MEGLVANYLKVQKRQQVISLLELGWSYRRIERETGVRRETIAGYDPRHPSKPAKVFPGSEGGSDPPDGASADRTGPKPAKVFPGSEPRSRSAAAKYHDAIVEGLDNGLTIQRVWQDLGEDYGYGQSYESVKRYVRGLRKKKQIVGVMHHDPGEEAQVDFFQGAPTLHPDTGQWRRPWVFRMTLCCSRHGYEEAVWDQKVETFLRLHENAFLDLGGVVKVIRHDNLKSGVVRACLYDPDINVIYAAFAEHWGFTPLPTRPRNPKESGKQERAGGYVKSNALKGKRFNSLEEQNAHLRKWNRTIARLRIHGTTRKQVWTHFLEIDQPALQPLAPERFHYFECGTRTVHPDGHVEVDGAFYPAAPRLLGQQVQVRWDSRFVRIYHRDRQDQDHLIATHLRVGSGQFARREGEDAPSMTSSQQVYLRKVLGRCERVGTELHAWALEAVEERGVRAFRLIQGVLNLTRRHPREAVLHAARRALEHRLFRYKDLQRLAQQAAEQPTQLSLLAEHPTIRPMNQYRLEDLV
jgi:transposase